jgi:hypothetical protein
MYWWTFKMHHLNIHFGIFFLIKHITTKTILKKLNKIGFFNFDFDIFDAALT